MEQPKIFFAGNIKLLRERKHLSQEQMAEKMEMTRSKLHALESGKTKAPGPEDFIRFSCFFKMSIDTLLKVDLRKLGELKIRDLEAGNDVYLSGGSIRVLAITVDKQDRENIEYVPVRAKAGYLSGYNDPEYIAGLPRLSLPDVPLGKTLRMFPTTGDSMLPFPEGADVIGAFVEDWRAIKAETPCIVVLKEQDIVFKLVTLDAEARTFTLKSQNSLYAPYQVPCDDVAEIWSFYKFQTDHIPEAQTDMQQLVVMMKQVQATLEKKK